MDLFAQLAAATAASAPGVAASAPVVTLSVEEKPKFITVSIEKVKNRTITVIYEFDFALDGSIKSPEEMLSKLKKKICNSNGFIRKPDFLKAKSKPKSKPKAKAKAKDEDEDEDEDEEEDEDEDEAEDKSDDDEQPKYISKMPQYVIQGNHSNSICRYIYSLGVKEIIRTGTA
jgi:translation initiation factor 1 (eIF-1/SUI1)